MDVRYYTDRGTETEGGVQVYGKDMPIPSASGKTRDLPCQYSKMPIAAKLLELAF